MENEKCWEILSDLQLIIELGFNEMYVDNLYVLVKDIDCLEVFVREFLRYVYYFIYYSV